MGNKTFVAAPRFITEAQYRDTHRCQSLDGMASKILREAGFKVNGSGRNAAGRRTKLGMARTP